ncbi:MAG: hypothetical protein NDI69_15900 [Bacteriovoracaceae bacterium]|nr:hypothetical protein [Bacteriovoracaceae bacterium]
MKEKTQPLKIYNVSHPFLGTESFSLLGDKYLHALPFKVEYVDAIDAADVIVWDGIMTPKNHDLIQVILEEMKRSKVLLLFNDSMTLLKYHPLVKLFDPTNLNYVEITGWSLLPEEILQALELCHQKLRNV